MIRKTAKTALKKVVGRARQLRAKFLLPELLDEDDPHVTAVGATLLETVENELAEEEQAWVSRIEARRASLRDSREQIHFVDFGAGTPESNRTTQQMRNGVDNRASVSSIANASKSPFWTLFLFKLLRKIQPASCVELGSCVGISGSYLGAALHLNRRGRLVTIEGSPAIARLA